MRSISIASKIYITFPKEAIQIINMHMKRYSAKLVIREVQVKTTVRHHFALTRLAIIKKPGDDKC